MKRISLLKSLGLIAILGMLGIVSSTNTQVSW